ncbi:MAG: KamA family radical SAM protein [Leptospiraceae bacterium]
MPGTVFDQPLTVQQKLEASDWLWQMQNRARTMEDIFRLRPELLGTPLEMEIRNRAQAFASASKAFRFAVTPYYLSLASAQHLCPVWQQILPDEREASDALFSDPDPLSEEKHMPVPGLTHRYPDRALWYLSHNCAVYCRFCMRKRKVSRSESAPGLNQRKGAIEYIRNHPEIQEVILSGGDPLSQSDEIIAWCLEQLRDISHIASLRIHTRMPVTCPQRITGSFCDMLESHGPITVITHFNHPDEISARAIEALKKIRKSGSLILNQSVLLKGINDDPEIQKALNLNLLRVGVKPYYIHQCDEVQGVSHFRVNLARGIEIQKAIRGRIPGPALPLYVIDLPGGGGKVPVDSSYFKGSSFQSPEFENFAGKTFYPVGDDF